MQPAPQQLSFDDYAAARAAAVKVPGYKIPPRRFCGVVTTARRRPAAHRSRFGYDDVRIPRFTTLLMLMQALKITINFVSLEGFKPEPAARRTPVAPRIKAAGPPQHHYAAGFLLLNWRFVSCVWPSVPKPASSRG